VNWLDLLLGVIILASVAAGIAKGLARAGLEFTATVLGLFCGLWFYGVAGAYVTPLIKSRHIANLIGFFMIFFGFALVGALLGYLLDRLFRLAKLTWLNRVLGGAFGLLRGVLIAAVVVMAMMAFPAKPPAQAVARSRMAPDVVGVAEMTVAIAPREIKDAFRNSYERLKQIWADSLHRGKRRLPEEEI
jgi:membrane protein required for colicin V production